MNADTQYNGLSNFAILSDCTQKELSWLESKAVERKFIKGETIYEEGDHCSHVYFVKEGSAKLGLTSSCGKTLIKNIVHESEIFGENIFTKENKRKEFAQVMKGTVILLAVKKEDFQKLMLHSKKFANKVIELTIHRLNALEKRMENFVFKKAKSRIVSFLVSAGKKKGIRIGIDELLINHGMSHKEIAFLTDTSRQTVARVLGELKKDDLIHFSSRKPSKILIRDMHSLLAIG